MTWNCDAQRVQGKLFPNMRPDLFGLPVGSENSALPLLPGKEFQFTRLSLNMLASGECCETILIGKNEETVINHDMFGLSIFWDNPMSVYTNLTCPFLDTVQSFHMPAAKSTDTYGRKQGKPKRIPAVHNSTRKSKFARLRKTCAPTLHCLWLAHLVCRPRSGYLPNLHMWFLHDGCPAQMQW